MTTTPETTTTALERPATELVADALSGKEDGTADAGFDELCDRYGYAKALQLCGRYGLE